MTGRPTTAVCRALLVVSATAYLRVSCAASEADITEGIRRIGAKLAPG